LFTELGERNRDLSEALEQQTATSEILRVISQSQTDVQPVFQTIADAVLRLCGATSANLLTFDGELLRVAALANVDPASEGAFRSFYPRAPGRETAVTRAVLTRGVVEIPDVLKDIEYAISDASLAAGFRSVLGIPLLREGNPIGAIAVGRPQPGPFTKPQIELVKTFADQAVIAIENLRLFTELESRTRELTRSVGELEALGEVGQAVSSTLDLETVLRTIVARATKLSGMAAGALYEYDAERQEFHLHTTENMPDDVAALLRAVPIRRGEGALGRMAVTGEPVQIHDIVNDVHYQSHVREALIRAGHRALLAIPLLREDHLLGGLVVNSTQVGEFDAHVIELLRTFASQSALAIQNARLFHEIEDKSRQLETASRHKSEFLANMSHELRTPLNAIIGFSEVLSEKLFGEINAKQEEYIADILESGRHLLDLINDILDLSKIEAGRMELELADFQLSKAVENALTLVRERASRHGIKLDQALDGQIGAIRADERKVKQVLLNLLSNALKFTPEGGRVEVRVAARDGMAEIAVTDTGVGIAPEDQETVFEEFRQVGASAKKREGTGLGLAISRKFIELHGGRIWVESQLGKGSTFAFTLPLNRDPSPVMH
jgi:signal transduction histidine kinase